jgi:hypothetical protein
LSSLFEAPNNFGPIWNAEAIETLKINKISFYVKGGKYKNNLSEKLTYIFGDEGKALNFNHFLYNISTESFSNSGFTYNSNGKLEKIDVFRFQEFGNIPPVLFNHDSIKTTAITSRNNDDFDSLIFYPTIEKPQIIVEIVNHKVNSVEIFISKGSNSTQIQALAKTIDSSLAIFDLAEKTVTFLENDLPISSFHLDAQWKKQEQSKTWEYNENMQPVRYVERLHGTLVKNIEISYDENNLPEELIVDRKKFIFYTAF